MLVAFSHHPPSSQWEPLLLPRFPGLVLWAWFRPPQLPTGVLVRVPPELVAVHPGGFPFSLADLLSAAGIDFHQLHSVSIFGTEWQQAAVITPYLAHPMPSVAPGASMEISINVVEQSVANPGSMMVPAATMPTAVEVAEPAVADTESQEAGALMYDRIDTAWRVSMQMERQMTGLRKKLAAMLKTLGNLDRDLGPDERLAADREDRDNWQDARRWVRELSARCHRELKNFDIGMTSGAGKRHVIEQVFKEVIEPRKPSNDLTNIHREFEAYRKDMTNLQKAMTAALQAAGQNGTQRSQRILATIRRKIKERRAKMREKIGGANMDKSVRRKS